MATHAGTLRAREKPSSRAGGRDLEAEGLGKGDGREEILGRCDDGGVGARRDDLDQLRPALISWSPPEPHRAAFPVVLTVTEPGCIVVMFSLGADRLCLIGGSQTRRSPKAAPGSRQMGPRRPCGLP